MGEEKRIKDLAAASSITNNDYLAMDNANRSAAKKTSAMPLKNVQASSDVYSSLKAYNVGDLVIQYNQLYRCHTDCAAASWATNSGYFDAVTLTDAITQLNNDLNNSTVDISSELTVTSGIDLMGAWYNKITKRVTILMNHTGPTANSITWCTVPTKYRPSKQTLSASLSRGSFSANYNLTTNPWWATPCIIKTDGTIVQTFPNSANSYAVYVVADYYAV